MTTTTTTMRGGILAGLVLGSALSVPATAGHPDPGFAATSASQYAKARQRALDQYANPPFMAASAARAADAVQDGNVVNVDPFRRDWPVTRGTALAVEVPSRYGVRMQATLYGPRDTSRHPGIVLLTGGNGPREGLEEFAHDLAESGYVVLGLEAQGDGHTAKRAPDPVPSTPEDEYCRPGNFGGWQGPQEMGIRETSQCAGGFTPAAAAPDAAAFATGTLAYYESAIAEDEAGPAGAAQFYDADKARKTFAALDAAAWLRSKANPWAHRLARTPLGIAGHSLGAHAAALAGNGDPQHRFGAVVSWDSFGSVVPTVRPRVPTLFFHHELDYGLPKRRVPAAELPGYRDAAAFRDAGVPTGVIVPDASTHLDFTFLDYPVTQAGTATVGLCPDCLPGLNASRDGTRVAVHYSRAWFDRMLKRDRTATDRLQARVYPTSSDATSIGQGTTDPATQRNVPYSIGGESATEHLSPLLPSWLAGPGLSCADLRRECGT